MAGAAAMSDTTPLLFEGALDWPAMTRYFAARAITGVESVSDDAYRRTVVVDGVSGAVELAPGGADHLLLRVDVAHLERVTDIAGRIRDVFNLDADMSSAIAHLEREPVIGELVRSRPGVRVPGVWDPFEIGVRAIVGQQVTVAGANTLTARLVARHGQSVPGLEEHGLSRVFPSATAIADADLDGLGFVPARAQAIRSFARAVVDGDVRLDRDIDLDDLVASVIALPGLGPWTAHYIALRLGEPDAFPASDLGLRRAMGSNEPLSTKELTAVAESWRPWRALAAAHLWMTLRDFPDARATDRVLRRA